MRIAVPFAPPGCFVVNVDSVTIGVGFRIRAFTGYQKQHPSLFDGSGADG